ATAVAADRRERPLRIALRQLRAPRLAQDGVDERGARMYQRLDRFVGAEALDELGVRFAQLDTEGFGRVRRGREPLRQVREPGPGTAKDGGGFGRFDIFVE